MKSISSNHLASVAVAALLWLPAAALAQSSQAPASAAPEGARPTAAQSSPLAGHPGAGRDAGKRVEQRIKERHAQLRITPAEQSQWDEFAQVMRENAHDMDQAFVRRAEQFHLMNAVQNMQSYEQIADEHARHLQKLVSAFQNLYNAMPDQQKQVADQVFRANAEARMQSHRARNE
jgi:periplasmic protein CpxP/Spy